MNHSKRLKRDTFLYFLGRIIPAFLSFASISVFVRSLGETYYGQYSLIISVALLISGGTVSWLLQGMLRYQSLFNATVEENSIFKQAIHYSLLFTLLFASIITCLVAYFDSSALKGDLKLSILFLMIVISSSLYSYQMTKQQANLKSKEVLYSGILRSMVSWGIPIIYMLIFSHSKQQLLWLILVLFILGNILGTLILSKPQNIVLFPRLDRKKNINNEERDKIFEEAKKKIQTVWNYGWPLGLWITSSTILNIQDRYIISWLVDLQSVGVYSAIYDIVYKSFGLFLTPILLAFHPLVMKEWNSGNQKNALNLINRTLMSQIAISIVLVGSISLISPWLVQIVLGHSNEAAIQLVFPIAAASAIWQLSMIIHKTLELENKTKQLLLFVLISLVINFIMNIIFIPYYGYVASAYTTLLAVIIYFIIVSYKYHKFAQFQKII